MALERRDIFSPSVAQSPQTLSPVGSDNLWRQSSEAVGAAAESFIKGAEMAGIREGAQLDAQGKAVSPEFKEGLGVIGRAYNEGALRAYKSSAQEDMRLAMEEAYESNPSDLTGFDQATEAFEKDFFSQVPEEAKQELFYEFAKNKNRYRGKTALAQVDRVKKEGLEEHKNALTGISDRAQRAARNGDVIEVNAEKEAAIAELQRMVDSGYLTPEQADSVYISGQRDVERQGLIGEVITTYATKGEEAAVMRVKELTEKIPEGWTVEEASDFNKQLLTELNQAKTEDDAIRTQEEIAKEFAYSNLIIKSKLDDFGGENPVNIYRQADGMLKTGQITEEQRAAIYNNINSSMLDAQKKLSDYSGVAERLGGNDGIVIDKKIADKFYTDIYSKEKQTPVDKAFFVDRMKFVPDQMKQEIEQGLLSGNPQVMASAADLADRLDEVPGIGYDYLSEQQRAVASQITSLSQVMPMEQAVKMALQTTDSSNKALVESRDLEIKKNYKKNPDYYQQSVENLIDKKFWGTGDYKITDLDSANINKEIADVTNALFRAGYKGNIDDAREKASSLVAKNWGDDDIGGDVTFRKYPMSWYYSVGGDTSYIKTEAVEAAKFKTGHDIPFNKIHFISDEETARTASTGEPVYSMMAIFSDGTPIPLGRWRPDKKAQSQKAVEKNRLMMEKERTEATQAPKQINIPTSVMFAPRTR